MTGVTIYPPTFAIVPEGGSPTTALYGPMLGGIVQNPATAVDQGLDIPEVLFIDLVYPAVVQETPTTRAIQPGQTFFVPANFSGVVSVNAASSGHKFMSRLIQPETQFPPTPIPSTFPPDGPSGLTETIPSYLYEEYNDDEDLLAFVAAYNIVAQEYTDWFNSLQLPIYTVQSGTLLDWVAEGIYGIERPSLSSGLSLFLGPFNTYDLNGLEFNGQKIVGPSDITVTSDDIFKRIITWNEFRGDGNLFNARWLKRRIVRFLYGTDGVDPDLPTTYQISVSFGLNGQVNITFINGVRRITGAAIFNEFDLNGQPFNGIESKFQSFTPLPNAGIFKEALLSGALQVPFQYTFIVNTGD